MKITIAILTRDSRSETLGINVDEKLTKLNFDSKFFVGYWIEMEDVGQEIKVLIGAETFLTPYHKKTIDLFDQILNDIK